jgi:hypothetical protein
MLWLGFSFSGLQTAVLGVKTDFNSTHCWAAKPMPNRSQSVMILLRIVTVAHMPAASIPSSDVYRVVMVISGKPTSKGMPTGIDLTATTMLLVMSTTLHGILTSNDKKTKYGTAMLHSQFAAISPVGSKSASGLRVSSFMESWKISVSLSASSLIM